ncbi:ATP-dependent helicase/nuclease subunit A [Keratinibaculum paraultunense]|uniref:DNA 3'-5' helicase n=1 Tax=Keratinibaculum paraultunense TaxID=1278232 RepID=A0A4R3KZ49_9FIRM|nr:UvrD-helicase domain-containing protein [Keratinibaculum paraultunense]QQY78983.1 UvrD-helicase domain-containing protein [Keratinibaculum paraultunense]TCS90604.1 ATP-dependent helicase/nuclease subunit A [Keratinibaculum paraultunense]
MKNTHAQDKAIKTIDKNVSVNAGAGTGKTKVLTERYIYILENGDLEKGKEIESIVAITFTKKATQEMKERIRKEIKNRIPQNEKWNRFYRDMEKANISTIHSFCGNILRENALKLGIDPMFTVLDDDEGDQLLEEVIQDILLKGIERDEKIYNLVRLFDRDDLNWIANDIKSLYYKIRTVGYTLQEVKKMTLDTIDEFKIDKDNIYYIKETFLYLMSKSRKNSKIYKLKDDHIWIKFYEDSYTEEELIPILEYLYDNIGTNSKEKDKIDELKRAIDHALMIREIEYRWTYDALMDLIIQIDEEYTNRKDELAALDYDDLQILTLRLLEDESIKKKYQNRFKYIMIDEFQDTNELQKNIFYKLCSKDSLLDCSNLFIVGDPKQSIYGFRGADLQVFYDVMEDIEKVSNQKPITLDKNFRSFDTILDFLNSLFGKLMGDKYDALESQHRSNNDIDVEILEKKDIDVLPNVNSSQYNAYVESRLIASRIKELVKNGEFNYGDFALLFRATTIDHIYEEALREYGIPYYNVGGKGFYESQEIIDVLNGLKAISNRYDTIAYIGFLRSPMIGISDKTIYWLLRHNEKNLLDTMTKDIPYIDKEQKRKLIEANRLLNRLIAKKDLCGVESITKELVDGTYFLETLLLQKGGKQALSNIYKFLDIAREFDIKHFSSLEDFIDYIENIRHKDESQGKIQSEEANVVKIMTIHKSKGLQFPVVIIPQMARGFNYNQPSILFNKEKGIGIKHSDKSPLYDIIRNELKEKEEEENKRILYVAMTRAKEKLIIGNQGQERGFKKIIKDHLDEDKVIYIDSVDTNAKEEKAKIKLIKQEIFNRKFSGANTKVVPLLVDIPGYAYKVFNSFSVSQYLDFRYCKKLFFLKHYNRFPVETLYFTSKEEAYTGRIIDPSTRGTIVHEFCEHYRTGVKIDQLLKDIVSSYGLLYNRELEDQLMSYIKNYLKYYREDYDYVYREKDFYIKIEDTYIHGIIDRINIKNGKAEILDFKTNRVDNKEELIEYYKPQLQLYAYAFQNISNIKVNRASILLLETGELENVNINSHELIKNYEEVKNFIDFVKKNNAIKNYDKNYNCNGDCVYDVICNMD